jgi:2,4-dienoyl-CoA reductase-like NADH-dependent reductase (Old Yellow Enzyme family)
LSPELFSPFEIGSVTLPHRIAVSPMAQYSSDDGFASDWHLVHLGSRAAGGAALVFTEAAAVAPEGRITPRDLGIWKDEHIPQLARICEFLHSQGAYAGVQIAHAGRKASMRPPWEGETTVAIAHGGWTNVYAPSAVPFGANYSQPAELDSSGIRRIVGEFRDAARRGAEAGFDVLEIHAAHGYLLHEFLSPLSNFRTDDYGGSFENRARLLLEVVTAVRSAWPRPQPLFVRISSTDWREDGWRPADSVRLAQLLKENGVDLIDVSSGGILPGIAIPAGPGYQTAISAQIRREAGIATSALGFITDPAQADHAIRTGQADLVLLAREMLRDPYWPLHAAARLGREITWPIQYLRAAPQGAQRRMPL